MALTYGFCLDDIDSVYDSAQFSNAFHALVGDGITPYGAQFSVTINGFTATLATGYALVAGRWVENDEPLPMSIQLSGNNEDRTDAIVVRADYEARKASLEVLVNVDAAAIQSDPSILRGDEGYSLVLYFIRVRRGATSLSIEDVTDVRENRALCGRITPLSEISESVLYIYRFLASGIDQEVARLIGLSNQIIQNADVEIQRIESDIQSAGGAPGIGELMVSRKHPTPESAWLLCNGEEVPTEYTALYSLLGGTLPDISNAYDRFRTYIYGGELR